MKPLHKADITGYNYPRIRNLPKEEQEGFREWLRGQTLPLCDETAPMSEWDWYYPWDYERWKRGLPIIDCPPHLINKQEVGK
jgi:hypothetical protein